MSEGRFLIRTDYHVLYGKDGYAITHGESIDEAKCFSSQEEAYTEAGEITDHWYEVVDVREFSKGTFKCPHCERDHPHQHVVDRKGYVHLTVLRHEPIRLWMPRHGGSILIRRYTGS